MPQGGGPVPMNGGLLAVCVGPKHAHRRIPTRMCSLRWQTQHRGEHRDEMRPTTRRLSHISMGAGSCTRVRYDPRVVHEPRSQMPTRLYLDSARMGLLSERARLAHLDYVRLAATEGCSLYFSQFLERGFEDWPSPVRRQYPALCDWHGIPELQDSLRRLVGAGRDCQAMVANRTAQLVKLAVRRLCENTRRILVSDLIWPSYRRILELERQNCRVGISTVPVRRHVRRGLIAADALLDLFALDYDRMGCDSLFVPVISHDGIRLPIDAICHRLNQIRPLRFVVVDGAQALGHVTEELGLQQCDIFVAGCHKWLQGHLPMGVAFLPRVSSAQPTIAQAERMMRYSDLDDPLLAFTREMITGRTQAYSETVNLASLFTCRAAITDRGLSPDEIDRQLGHRLRNAKRVKRIAAEAGWSSLPHVMPTGIVMLRSQCPSVRASAPERIREFFVAHSVSVSTYEDGIIRLAMPDRPLSQGDIDLLAWVLRRCRFGDVSGMRSSRCNRFALSEAV